eukprot:1382261-Amphidinium_carterae.1
MEARRQVRGPCLPPTRFKSRASRLCLPHPAGLQRRWAVRHMGSGCSAVAKNTLILPSFGVSALPAGSALLGLIMRAMPFSTLLSPITAGATHWFINLHGNLLSDDGGVCIAQ